MSNNVQAVILTRNAPANLNALLWSLFNQTCICDSILIVNTGGWAAGEKEIGATLDIISEVIPITVRRIKNADLGSVHAQVLRLASAEYTWFFQDDAVAHFRALEELLRILFNETERHAVVPRVLYPDYQPKPGEREREMPHQFNNLNDMTQSLGFKLPERGACLGLLLRTALAHKIADTLENQPMFIDDLMISQSQPLQVPSAWVYHTRPERLRIERVLGLLKTKVLPEVQPKT